MGVVATGHPPGCRVVWTNLKDTADPGMPDGVERAKTRLAGHTPATGGKQEAEVLEAKQHRAVDGLVWCSGVTQERDPSDWAAQVVLLG